ncbi:MAG TPA: hypothetical protein VH539_04700 [Gemmatimonadaceae bacterium]|jgi:hypothetical protein
MGRAAGTLTWLLTAWRRHLLQREVRFAWGPRPRVVVHSEGDLWSKMLNERWLPSATERTLVLGPSPRTSGRPSALPLEWRVYQEWGSDFKSVLPPVALIVHRSGRIDRIDFASAMMKLAEGDDTLLLAQLDELAHLSHRP